MNIKFPDANILSFSFMHHKSVVSLRPMKLPYLDLTYCLEGQMEYLFNGSPVTLNAGDAILFPPGAVRQRRQTDIQSYYASINIMFDGTISLPVEGKVSACVSSDTVYVLEIINKAFNSPSEMKNEKCFSLFTFLINQLIETSFNTDSPYVKTVKQYIAENLTENITVEMLAQIAHLTPQYLCNLFKKETGETIFGYIIEQRISLAKNILITEKQLSIPEIAEKCGFRDFNYFSVTFKKHVGIPPTQYKKLIN